MRSADSVRRQAALARVAARAVAGAVAGVVPASAEMCGIVRQGAAQTANQKTNPPRAHAAADSKQNISNASSAVSSSAPIEKGAGMCGDVRADAAQTRNHKTNPPQPPPSSHARITTNRDDDVAPVRALTPRQVASARLLALGRCGRAVAAEVGVNEHTITKWRRTRRFDDEVRRQHTLVLAEQVRQRRAESVDAYAAVAERIVRKYGMMR
jgi:DNA-binding NarL/FixJ family response regulator